MAHEKLTASIDGPSEKYTDYMLTISSRGSFSLAAHGNHTTLHMHRITLEELWKISDTINLYIKERAREISEKSEEKGQQPSQEFRSWWDLSEEEQDSFIKYVVDNNVQGWDELKEACTACGFEADENMPTISELKEDGKGWLHREPRDKKPQPNQEVIAQLTKKAYD